MSKKGSTKAQQEQSVYVPREVVLAKVRGFPPWPGMIVDPDNVPARVAKERPNGKKATWYAVRFFPVGDYAWVVPKDISKLKKHEIESYINEPHKRSGDLLSGYKIALNPISWEAEKAVEQAELERAAEDAQIDELDDEDASGDDEEPEKRSIAPKSKKRKRESDAGSSATTKKSATTTRRGKKGSVEPSSTRKRTANGKGKRNGVKSKAMVESEDEGGEGEEEEDAGPSKHTSPPPAKKAKRDEDDIDPAVSADPEAQKVREWRHRLQKAFLNKVPPKEDDMPSWDELFTTVETYENMTIQYLQFSKIGKVMRHIQSQSDGKIPRDEEFKFKDRAKALVEKWHQILNSNKPNGAASTTAKGEEITIATDPETDNMDVDAKGDPEVADDKENIPENEDAVGEDANVSAMEGDITALADTSMGESNMETTT